MTLFFFFPISFGDKDLDLRMANPLHLRKLLEDKRFSRSRIVLLHASYPFSKEASYLASVYKQVKFSVMNQFYLCVPNVQLPNFWANNPMPLLSGVP